ncbi:MAG: hypothetical protein RI894_1480 [Bacteroidota bacterium]|jgi:MGT family glycosyltransferase
MKIVYFNIPAHGHVNPTLPLAAELVRRGHQLIYYGFPDFEHQIRSTGAEFRAYPIDFEDFKTMKFDNMLFILWRLIHVSDILTNEILPTIAAAPPDLILHDSMASWGRYIGRAANIPAVSTCVVFAFDPVLGKIPSWRLLGKLCYDWFTNWRYFMETRAIIHRLAKTYHFKPHLPVELFNNYEKNNIVFTAQSIQPFGKQYDLSRYHFVGCSIAKRPDSADFSWAFRNKQPLIYVSLGTLMGKDGAFFKTIMAAFANAPYQLLISIGQFLEIEDLCEIPRNAVVKKQVPQLDVLQQAAVFVTHAGLNSLNESVYYGVPMVMVPQQIEQDYNARHFAKLGCGILAKPNSEALLSAVSAILNNDFYRKKCQKYSIDLQNAGGYLRAVDIIEQIGNIQ